MRYIALILAGAISPLLHAQSADAPVNMRQRVAMILKADVLRTSAQLPAAIPSAKSAPIAPAAVPADLVVMDPYFVRGPRVERPKLYPDETYVWHFLRTGTLLHLKGNLITTTADVEGADAPHGFGKAELAVHLNW